MEACHSIRPGRIRNDNGSNNSGKSVMHSDREVPDAPPGPADVPPSGIYEALQYFTTKKERQPQLEQTRPKRKRAATRYGGVPNDLDRIAQANCEMEVLDLIDQVLQVLRRSGRMAEVPELLHMDRLTTSAELRMAMKRMQGAQRFMEDGEWHADAMLVLRAVLTAADEKLRELRRRE